ATPRFHAEAAQATPQRVRRTQVTIIPAPTGGSSTPPGSGVSPASPRKPGGHTPPLNGHVSAWSGPRSEPGRGVIPAGGGTPAAKTRSSMVDDPFCCARRYSSVPNVIPGKSIANGYKSSRVRRAPRHWISPFVKTLSSTIWTMYTETVSQPNPDSLSSNVLGMEQLKGLSPVRADDLEPLRRGRRLSLQDLLNVFTPTSPIDDP